MWRIGFNINSVCLSVSIRMSDDTRRNVRNHGKSLLKCREMISEWSKEEFRRQSCLYQFIILFTIIEKKN